MKHCKIAASSVLGWNKIAFMDWKKNIDGKREMNEFLHRREELSSGVQSTLFTLTAHTRRLSGPLGNRWTLIPCLDGKSTATQQTINAGKIHRMIVNISVDLIQNSLRSLSPIDFNLAITAGLGNNVAP